MSDHDQTLKINDISFRFILNRQTGFWEIFTKDGAPYSLGSFTNLTLAKQAAQQEVARSKITKQPKLKEG